MKLTAKQQLVLNFTKACHYGQRRKYDGKPYWTHPLAVAKRLSNIGCDYDFMIEIALLHDVFEDQYDKCDEVTMLNGLKLCGYSYFDAMFIVRGVIELTDVYTHERAPDMNRAIRKEKEAIRLWNTSSVAQTVKYADLIENTISIVQHDRNFANVYLEEKEFILKGMRDGHCVLFNACARSLRKSKLLLKQ